MNLIRMFNRTQVFLQGISALLFMLLILMFISSGCSNNDMGTNYSGYSDNTGNNGGTQGANDIFIQGMSFSPTNKTIAKGTTVKWTNKDSYSHTVTSGKTGSPTGLFDSGTLGSNGTFSYTFSQTGVFTYYCKLHSSMSGTITVQ